MDEYISTKMSLGQYLDDVYDENISVEQDVQRNFNWGKEAINNLIYSAISHKVYIPSLILAEEKKSNGTTKKYVVDGGHRTTALKIFNFDGYRITKAINEYMVSYEEKCVDEDGNYIYDEDGDIKKEKKYFDLRGRTFDELPKELQNKFRKYNIEIITYPDTTEEETSDMVRLYNEQSGMNTSQKGLTYLGKYAGALKKITKSNRFLKDGTALTELEKKKGVWERVVAECVMAVNHFETWKKAPKDICHYLNEHASEIEFDGMETYFNRLAPFSDKTVNPEVSNLFASKNLCIWMIVFDRFAQMSVSDKKFGEFLTAFVSGLKDKEVNENTWETLNDKKNTKDKSAIIAKVDYLMALLNDFLHIENQKDVKEEAVEEVIAEEIPDTAMEEDIEKQEEIVTEVSVVEENSVPTADEIENKKTLDFVQEVVDPSVDMEDVDMYKAFLDDYVRDDSNVKKVGNTVLVAMLTYAFNIEKDNEFSEWIEIMGKKDCTYSPNDSINFRFLKSDFDKYLEDSDGRNVA